MAVKVTIDNVRDVLAAIGCEGAREEARGQDWHRIFIHVPQPDGIPLSIGRVMFRYSLFLLTLYI